MKVQLKIVNESQFKKWKKKFNEKTEIKVQLENGNNRQWNKGPIS